MGTGEFLRMVAPESQSQCYASPLTLAGLKQSWPRGSCRLPTEPLEIWSAQHWVTQFPSSNEPSWAELLFEQMVPLHRLAVTPKRNFMPGVKLFQSWCSALRFIPRGENSSGFILPNEWELAQPGVPVWHTERPEMTIHLCLFPNFACTNFCGHPKGKKNKWGTQEGILPPKLSPVSLLAIHSACFEFH